MTIMTKLAPPLRVDCPRDRFKRPTLHDPVTGEPTTYQRVTTLAGMIDDTYSLTLWKMRGVAKGVAWRDDLRIAAATTDDSTKEGKAALDEICERALDAAGGSAGAAMGTAFHRVTQIADAWPDVPVEQYCPPELRAELAAYTTLIREHGLTLPAQYQERTGICPDAGTAGTWDDLVLGGPSCDCGRYHVGDKKSGQHEFEYGQGKIAAQLAMYSRVTSLWLATGGGYEQPPDICPRVGYVLYVPIGRTDKACVYPVDLTEGWRRVELAMAIREARSAKRGLFGAPLTLAVPGTTTIATGDGVEGEVVTVKPKRTRRTKAQIAEDAAKAAFGDRLAADIGLAEPVTVVKAGDATAYLAGTSDELPAAGDGLDATRDALVAGLVDDRHGTAFLMNGELKPGPVEAPFCPFAGQACTSGCASNAERVCVNGEHDAAVALLETELGAEVARPDRGQLDREREAALAGLHNGTTAQDEMERGKLAEAIAAARGQDDLVTAYGLWSAHWTPEHDQMAVRRLIALVGTREGLERIWEQYQQVWTDDLTAAGNARLAELARL